MPLEPGRQERALHDYLKPGSTRVIECVPRKRTTQAAIAERNRDFRVKEHHVFRAPPIVQVRNLIADRNLIPVAIRLIRDGDWFFPHRSLAVQLSGLGRARRASSGAARRSP